MAIDHLHGQFLGNVLPCKSILQSVYCFGHTYKKKDADNSKPIVKDIEPGSTLVFDLDIRNVES